MDKTLIKRLCEQKIENQIIEIQNVIDDVQKAVNQETKSTAGDKHDTARALAQNEVERLGKQLFTLERMRSELYRIPINDSSLIQLGSLIQTNQGTYYLSVALGKISHEDFSFFAISVHAPLGQRLLTKRAGESVVLPNGTTVKIEQVY